jgi:site-specific DNA-cytosine methylase
MKKSIVILDLFAGYGGAELSANYAGIKVKKSYISEIEPSALKVLKKRFPNAIFVGDVRKLKGKDFLDANLICAGSPCQSFSMAGRKKGMVTTTNVEVRTLKQYLKLKKEEFQFEGQSYLFWEFVRLKKEITDLQKKMGLPVAKFLLENVDMTEKWKRIISDAVGVEPVLFDAALVSAQSRLRLFWTDIAKIEVPEDMNIKLGDVIKGAENGVGFRGRKVGGDDFYTYPQTTRRDNKSNCLVTTLGSTTKDGKRYGTGFIVTKSGVIKQLTIEQAEILQGLEPGYTNVEGVSKTARIKMIGNGWPIPVTGRIISYLKKDKTKVLKNN